MNIVPKAEASPKLLRELGMEDKPKEPKMTIPERQAKLIVTGCCVSYVTLRS